MKKYLSLLVLLTAAACSKGPENLPTSFVAPSAYENYDCDQLTNKMRITGYKTMALYYKLKADRNGTADKMGVGVILFWPALFFLEGGESQETAEYSLLKGQFAALKTNADKKQCVHDIISPEDLIKEQAEKEKELRDLQAKKRQTLREFRQSDAHCNEIGVRCF